MVRLRLSSAQITIDIRQVILVLLPSGAVGRLLGRLLGSTSAFCMLGKKGN